MSWHFAISPAGDPAWLDDRLRFQKTRLQEAYRQFARQADKEFSHSAAAEWILDNYHVIRQAWRQIREDMPKNFYRQLPKLDKPPLKGKPRIYGVALDAIQACQGDVKTELLKEFLISYQESAVLDIGEIWAFPVMLRLGVLDYLTLATGKIQKAEAPDKDPVLAFLPELEPVSDETAVAYGIQNLRAIAAQDWKDFFEQVCLVEKILKQEPSGAYGLMDFESRDRYRKTIETLAGNTHYSETEVAQEVVRLAGQQDAENPAVGEYKRHIGFYLMDSGRGLLETHLGFRPSMGTRMQRWFTRHPALLYLGAIGVLALIILAALTGFGYAGGLTWLQLGFIPVLFLIPVIITACSLINWAVPKLVSPRVLPKLDFQDGIPADCRTIVVIPALLSDSDEISALLRQLELHSVGNPDPGLFFALLSDLNDAPQKEMPGDRDLIAQAVAGIEELNKRYHPANDKKDGNAPFFLFHRERLWNASEGKWMGWERKRGKLDEFNRLLSGSENTSYAVRIGELSVLSEIRYVITLDADTLLPRESFCRLIGTLAHPLNRLRIDARTGEGVGGYTILQPRTEIHPVSANRSFFTRIFSGSRGLDLYSTAVSDVYQDLFGEGIYTGKGIYDRFAFESILFRRIPDNALLSHDLIEGLHVRVGLVTDIVLLEEFPPSYPVYTRRLHRWVRGDWQLLPWLLLRNPRPETIARPYRLSLISRWKIFDNLVRSLFQPAMLVLLISIWLVFPGSALVWTFFALLVSAAPLAVAMGVELPHQFRNRRSLKDIAASFRLTGLRWLLMLAFLPYEALITLDAIFRTLYRISLSHRRLLEWTTSAQTARALDRKDRPVWFWQQMWIAPLVSLCVAFLVAIFHFQAFAAALPLLAAWFFSPHMAYRISRPIEYEGEVLESGKRYQLRRLARRTWFFFERFVGPEDCWLPPDHFQESPLGTVAHRSSPTNMGLMLLSTLGAYDLGYIGISLLCARLRNAIDSMEQLERYRGHFFNWYDTRNLNPLHPRYVSTVDSGNLAASLVALRQGSLGLNKAPVLRWQRWQGLLDTLDVLDDIVAHFKKEASEAVGPMQAQWDHIRSCVLAVQNDPNQWTALLNRLADAEFPELDRRLELLVETKGHLLKTADLHSLRLWAERIHYHLRSARRELRELAPWILMMDQLPGLLQTGNFHGIAEWEALKGALPLMPIVDEVETICETGLQRLFRLRSKVNEMPGSADRSQALAWCAQLGEGLMSAQKNIRHLLKESREIGRQADEMIAAMDFRFLFNKKRQLFRIGYNMEAGVLDSNHYDLMASEARITSLVAIAKGDVPQSHWLHLSRPMVRVDDTQGLLSWSGSMFEYLMPTLLMRENEASLLGQSNRAAIFRQIAFGKEKSLPWGISESAYYRFNADMHYQYSAFGVPGLGYKRGLENDMVIAPYASLLALPIRPKAVVENLERFAREKVLGDYGFYEAVDYTPARLPLGEKKAVVQSFYSHHQGMIFLSLLNYLDDWKMVNRFHGDARIQSVALLLEERLPESAPLERPEEQAGIWKGERQERVALDSWSVPVHAPFPQVHLLSNGQMQSFITSAGGGFAALEDIGLTRWRADTILDNSGTWIYVRDQENDALRSATYQPAGMAATHTETRFWPHKADFRTTFENIVIFTEITVPPEDAVEIRRLTITNQDDRVRRLFLASYGEVVLALPDEDRRHPAFNKLFVEGRYLSECNGLIFQRRLRSAEESPIFLIHGLTPPAGIGVTGTYENDKSRFIGRGRTIRNPVYFTDSGFSSVGKAPLSLDPIMSVGQEIELEPNQTARIAWFTLADSSRSQAMETAKRYQKWAVVDRAFDDAEAQSRHEFRRLELTIPDLALMQSLLSVLLYPHPALRADPKTLSANTKGQSGLWPHAISGDYPIVLVRVYDEQGVSLVQDLLRAHAYWRNRGLKIDLVILNMKETGYSQEVQGQLHRLLIRTNSDAWLNHRGGIFLLRADQIGEADLILLATASRAILDSEKGTLESQLADIYIEPAVLPDFIPAVTLSEKQVSTPGIARPADLLFDNGLGGFTADGREYVIYLEPGSTPPAPWINVIANPDFGFMVSESGSGNTWAINSGENRLTPWHNDPVSDPSGEALYLRDEETAEVWSPTPQPAGDAKPYLVRHGAGYTVFEHHSHGFRQWVRMFTPVKDPVKIIQLRLENTENHIRRMTATYYAEWVLGADRETMQPYVVTTHDDEGQALLVRNPYNTEFGDRVAFLSADTALQGLTASRSEFLGRMGGYRRPAALGRIGLNDTTTAGIDPCGAVQVHINLPPGEVREVNFLIGQGADREDAQRLAGKYRSNGQIDKAWGETAAFWEDLLGALTIETPDPAMDLMLNRWLVYQNLSCRIRGRSALYQSSGAYGFRDQLQDVMGIFLQQPETARQHILRAARHQFEAGDVLHWWHPPSGRGVRTRITDDLLWLPYVTAQYVKITGDQSVLSENLSFLQGEPLKAEEQERYGLYESTAEAFSLYEHCVRAIGKAATRGSHGIPLIGAGDWNDGMNRVGIHGRGESVWLGWFLYATLTDFAEISRQMEDDRQADRFRQTAGQLQKHLEASAWDGNWYLRGFYDDGVPLGSSQSDECRIDSIAQSWAVLSGGAQDSTRRERAMEAVAKRLVQHEKSLIQLFTPPFDKTSREPGYIKGYPPGIRENGGQYTHAATWAVWAFAQLGQGDRAEALFRMLNPVYHGNTPEKIARYGVEPYVVSADVYSMPPHTGRGGWTWYTGSAGWMYRLGLQAILGFCRVGNVLRIYPCIPKDWHAFKLTYRYGKSVYHIHVTNPNRVNTGVVQIVRNGEVLPGGDIVLVDENREYQVEVEMG
ncbi:MAG: cyclic beta 1-2 glucan synthetase [Desulfobacterales bacterium]|nr:cyclic beta 1-2 glucan synthetase [Desulfobacterales bacterium]